MASIEEQIQKAVQIAYNPSNSNVLLQEALNFIKDLKKNASSSWKPCLNLLINKNDYPTKFFALQIVDIHINNISLLNLSSPNNINYSSNINDLNEIKDVLFNYFKFKIINENLNHPDFLKKKLSATFTNLFLSTYLNIWPDFFKDFTNISIQSELAMYYYLDILIYIHQEIADQSLSLSLSTLSNNLNDLSNNSSQPNLQPNDQSINSSLLNPELILRRNSNLKDIIRLNDTNDLILNLKNLLINSSNNILIIKSLSVLGSWSIWIDINLIINNGFLNIILNYLSNNHSNNINTNDNQLTIALLDSLNNIIKKKMSPNEKIQLLSLLDLAEIANTLFQSNQVLISYNKNKNNIANNNDNVFDDDEYVDLMKMLTKLTNTFSNEYLSILSTSISSSTFSASSSSPSPSSNLNSSFQLTNEIFTLIFNHLFNISPLILLLLSNDYDDVSELIFPFLSNFLSFLKKNSKFLINNNNSDQKFNENLLQLLSKLLSKIIIKMKFDDDDDGLDDESIETFNDFRSKIKSFQDSIAQINSDLYFNKITNIIESTLFFNNNPANNTLDNEFSNIQINWQAIELGLYQLTNLSNSLRNNLLNLPKNSIQDSKPFQTFKNYLINLINQISVINNNSSESENNNNNNNENNILLIKFNHPLIQLLFFELIIKHYNFFISSENLNINSNKKLSVNENEINLKLIKEILNILNSKFGLYNENEKVQLRSWYLFYRFIKLTKPNLDSFFLKDLVINVSQNLLKIQDYDEIESNNNKNNNNDEELVDESNFETQLYLFETIGILIGLMKGDVSSEIEFIDFLLNPIFQDISNNLEKYQMNSLNEEINKRITFKINHCLISIGNFLKGIDNENGNKKDERIYLKLVNIIDCTLVILENLNKYESIRDGSRFIFSRIIPLVSSDNNNNNNNSNNNNSNNNNNSSNIDISNHLSRLIGNILIVNDLKCNEICDLLRFLGQIIHNYQQDKRIYELINNLFSPLFEKIFSLLNQGVDNDGNNSNGVNINLDIERDKNNLVKGYLSFLLNLTVNHFTSLLISEINIKMFNQILNIMFFSIIRNDNGGNGYNGGYNYSYKFDNSGNINIVNVKNCFNFLNNYLNSLSNLEKKDLLDNNIEQGEINKREAELREIDEYLIKNIVSASFEIPFKEIKSKSSKEEKSGNLSNGNANGSANGTGKNRKSSIKFNLKKPQNKILAMEIATSVKVLYANYKDILINYLAKFYFVEIGIPVAVGELFLQNLVALDVKEFKNYYLRFIQEMNAMIV
ncbi:Ran GTPase-binding protein LOS1 ASCRUDRAFT_121925 [Ascoidea rubescens DSM 1968]|uniref:Exportin-T n=1 Tax=Ascoidea rubescens DSM 1968 TaxID=1344418 RepID=A0A1D2V9V0_9ASCO|nr:hypothetical protein ASCRUDRAFT_121925 [Ascoidea rubescens DSM 1968]ODV58277.1 hypothetical protein ASCRUDRAFT_121925 [Ascoidea rubescens DSM 1968]